MLASLVEVRPDPVVAYQPTEVVTVASGGPSSDGPQRPENLQGKIVAVIDSDSPGKHESYFTRALIRELRARYEVADVIWVRKANRTHPPQPELWQEVLDRADVGISMYGGCGTCSSRTMRDAIEMQREGIPAIAIAHEDLKGSIDAMKKISKADTPYVLVTRPFVPTGDWDKDATDELVIDRILPAVVAELTSGTVAVRMSA